MKKTKKHGIGLFFRGKEHRELLLFERKTFFALIAISFFSLLVYFFRTDAQLLFSNIVNPLPVHEPFDGISAPVKEVPAWVQLTEAERKATYSEIPREKFILLPPYIPARLEIPFETLAWNNKQHDDIRNGSNNGKTFKIKDNQRQR